MEKLLFKIALVAFLPLAMLACSSDEQEDTIAYGPAQLWTYDMMPCNVVLPVAGGEREFSVCVSPTVTTLRIETSEGRRTPAIGGLTVSPSYVDLRGKDVGRVSFRISCRANEEGVDHVQEVRIIAYVDDELKDESSFEARQLGSDPMLGYSVDWMKFIPMELVATEEVPPTLVERSRELDEQGKWNTVVSRDWEGTRIYWLQTDHGQREGSPYHDYYIFYQQDGTLFLDPNEYFALKTEENRDEWDAIDERISEFLRLYEAMMGKASDWTCVWHPMPSIGLWESTLYQGGVSSVSEQ